MTRGGPLSLVADEDMMAARVVQSSSPEEIVARRRIEERGEGEREQHEAPPHDRAQLRPRITTKK